VEGVKGTPKGIQRNEKKGKNRDKEAPHTVVSVSVPIEKRRGRKAPVLRKGGFNQKKRKRKKQPPRGRGCGRLKNWLEAVLTTV